MVLDVNVLVAVHRDDHPDHAEVRAWFDRLLAGEDRFGVPDSVWSSFVRISTNRRVFGLPTPLEAAFAFVHAVRAQPRHVRITPSPGHVSTFERLCQAGRAAGDLAPDAYLAAFALELDCELVSLDRDFARFPGLRWRRP